MSNLILDTCGFIWLSLGGGQLSKKAIQSIDQADFVYVSSISAWEIGFRHSKNRLKLPLEPEEWFHEVCEHHSVSIINISPEIGFKANQLPWHHKDPADRLIIATAILHNLTIVTQDRCFPDYEIETLG